MKIEIENGRKFGRLLVVEKKERNEKGHLMFLCLCECGNYVTVRGSSLLTNHTFSCGCYIKDLKTKHGIARTRIYRIHKDMRHRCNNKKRDNFYLYGARGITVCEEWLGEKGALNFYNWAIKNGYNDKLSIDRIDNNKGYSPDNCRWVTSQMQAVNQRIRKENKTGYKGVYKKGNRYISYITNMGKRVLFGYYKTKEEALKERNDYIIANNLPHAIQEINS